MTDIFISHSSVDEKLADLFLQFLKEAIGVPAAAIFCSSVPGHGIPLAEDFNAYMKDQIQQPKLVILLMTEQYMESAFCLMELGAAWAKSHKTLPIVVPPVPFSTVTKTLGLKWAWNIDEKAGLIDLRQLIKDSGITLEKRTEHDWEKKRTQWNLDLKKVRAGLKGATKVAAEDHQKLQAELAEKDTEISNLEELLGDAQQKIEALKALKDEKAVKAIEKDFSGADPEAEFEGLLKAVNDAKPSVANSVFRYIILDYFGKSPQISWSDNDVKDNFGYAVDRKLLNDDSIPKPVWGSRKLASLKEALGNLKVFIESDEGQAYANEVDSDVPMELDDVEFWEKHLHLW